jgi:hypothetical protein
MNRRIWLLEKSLGAFFICCFGQGLGDLLRVDVVYADGIVTKIH